MRSSKPLRLAVLITLIVLIVAANTLTVLFALRRGETGAAQSTDAPAVKQTENAPQITASTVQPQKIILRGIGVICRSVDDRTVGRRCCHPVRA